MIWPSFLTYLSIYLFKFKFLTSFPPVSLVMKFSFKNLRDTKDCLFAQSISVLVFFNWITCVLSSHLNICIFMFCPYLPPLPLILVVSLFFINFMIVYSEISVFKPYLHILGKWIQMRISKEKNGQSLSKSFFLKISNITWEFYFTSSLQIFYFSLGKFWGKLKRKVTSNYFKNQNSHWSYCCKLGRPVTLEGESIKLCRQWSKSHSQQNTLLNIVTHYSKETLILRPFYILQH